MALTRSRSYSQPTLEISSMLKPPPSGEAQPVIGVS